MRVLYHPEFPKDIRRFESEYSEISTGLASRFRSDVDVALGAVKFSPNSAGHLLNLGSQDVRYLRRRNLKSFPFFILYGVTDELLIFGSVIPSRSDPLTWLLRFEK